MSHARDDLSKPSLWRKLRAVSGPSDSSSGIAGSTQLIRPPEGLARGVWELPPSAFYAAGGVLLLSSALYAAYRMGLFSKRRMSR
jgi:hypothetical protein